MKYKTLKLTYKDGKQLEVPQVVDIQTDENGLMTVTYSTDYGVCTITILAELLTSVDGIL